MRLATGRYASPATRAAVRTGAGETVAIAVSLGMPTRGLGYPLAGRLVQLAPHPSYLKAPFEEYRGRYLAALERMGPERVLGLIRGVLAATGATGAVLLCWEDLRTPGAWCHPSLLREHLAGLGLVVEELEPASGPPPAAAPAALRLPGL